MARRKSRQASGVTSRPFPVRIGGAHRWEYIQRACVDEHGGKPATFMRAVLEGEIDRRLALQPAPRGPVLPAGQDPHAVVRKALLALAGLVGPASALADGLAAMRSANDSRPDDLMALTAAIEAHTAAVERLVGEVRGYARFAFKPSSDENPDIGASVDDDEL